MMTRCPDESDDDPVGTADALPGVRQRTTTAEALPGVRQRTTTAEPLAVKR